LLCRFPTRAGVVKVRDVPTQRRARRLSSAQRKQQLLEHAVRVFAERGLARANHRDVAAAADVSVPAVFSYFKTRRDLVQAVLDLVGLYYETMAERFHRSGMIAPRALLNHAIAFATSVDTDPEYARLVLEWSTAVRDDIWPLFLRFHERMVQRCDHTIRRGQFEGTIGRDVDAESAALMIVGSSWIVIQMSFTRWSPERIHRFMLAQLRGAIGADAVARALA
jgi:TetR/AcrR family hemagglutinin/protease transcriptional regulator